MPCCSEGFCPRVALLYRRAAPSHLCSSASPFHCSLFFGLAIMSSVVACCRQLARAQRTATRLLDISDYPSLKAWVAEQPRDGNAERGSTIGLCRFVSPVVLFGLHFLSDGQDILSNSAEFVPAQRRLITKGEGL